jgi:peptide/nickel transport system substrate-binding protein
MLRDEHSISLLDDVLRGRVSRRGLIQRAAALGLGTSAVATLLKVMPDQASAQSTATGSVVWSINSDPANLFPFGGTSSSNMWGKEHIYDSLLEWDQDLNIQPALAESYESAPDATSYTFHLRQGVTFHDGTPFTAKDVKYSIETSLDPPAPGVKYAFLANIAEVVIVDDYTVTFNMAKPDPTIPGVLAWARYSSIVPDGIYERTNGTDQDLLSHGIGTGPFKLVNYTPNDSVVYTANESYWKAGVPCIKDLTLKILTDEQSNVTSLRAGEIDGATFSADVASTLEGDDEITILQGLFAAPRVIQFNTTKPEYPWRDVRVRQAINKVVDRDLIRQNVYAGQAVVTGAIAPGYGDWFIPEEELLANFYAQDVDGAKALMAEAGYADGFSVTLQAISAPREYTQIAEIMKEALSELNIDVTVQPLEIGQFADNVGSGNYEWCSTGRGMRGDPSGFVIDFRQGTSNNVTWFGDGYNNDELNAAYDEALSTTDSARRHELYRRIQEIIATEVPHLYTLQPYKFQAARNRITGMYVAYTDFNTGLRTACAAEE